MTASPCVGLCRLDPGSELCTGCARSGAEITAWKDAGAAARARIWAELPGRRARLGIQLYRLAWNPDEVGDFVAQTLQADQGSWSVGVPGASVRWALGGDDGAPIERDGPTITAQTATGAIRFMITDRVRVLALAAGTSDASSLSERIILAIPRSAALPPPLAGLTPLGLDQGAIRPTDRTAWLFDLGLPTAAVRCCLRTADSDCAAQLTRQTGRSWGDALADLHQSLIQDRAEWVVANSVVRVEIGSSSARSGLELELDPAALAAGRETPDGIDLPGSFLPCAIYDPTPVAERSGHRLVAADCV